MLKEDTLFFKGIAISMMLWLHLFSNIEIIEECEHSLLFLNGKPLVYVLTKIASCCVPLYIFLGGYGLAKTYQNKKNHSMHNGRRALSLYVNYLIVFALFIPLGCIINPNLYPGNILTLLLNLCGLIYTYNGAWWFLLPYIILTVFSYFIIHRLFANNIKQDILALIFSGVLYVLCYILKDIYIPKNVLEHILLVFINCIFMLFSFVVGILYVKYDLIQKSLDKLHYLSNKSLFAILILICFIKLLLGNSSIINLPFVLLFIPLMVSINKANYINKLFIFLGKHSANMWLTHYFFCWFIFGNRIYKLYYPIVIFLCLILLSILSSFVIKSLFTPLKKMIRKE